MAIVVGQTKWWGEKNPGLLQLGAKLNSGILICKQGSGIVIYASPYSTEVSRTWYCRCDAAIVAQTVTGCTGWFIPSKTSFSGGQLSCYFRCRSYWDCYSRDCYWGNNSWFGNPGQKGCHVNFTIPNPGHANLDSTNIICARAFRCVSY